MSADLAGLVDPERLAGWLDERLPGAGEPLAVRRVSSGASNEMFELRRGPHRWVLRRPPHVKVAPTAHDMAREFRILRALDGTGVPHPEAFALCEDPEVAGAPFYVMGFVDGFTPRDPLPPPFDTDPATHRRLGEELVDGLAALAKVDWRAQGLEGFGRPDGFLERQVGRWLGQLDRYRTRDIPGIDEVARWLEENRPSGSEPGIIHGDYQFINTMFHHGAPARLAAIVDWEQSTVGDPLLDLGWLIAGWHHEGEEPAFGGAYFRGRRGLPRREELAERYARATGRSLDRLDYYVVLALFKLACVLEGSYYRFITGKSDHPMHEKMGEWVLRLIRRATEISRAGGL